MQKNVYLKLGFEERKKVCVPKTGFRGAKKNVYLKLGFEDHQTTSKKKSWEIGPDHQTSKSSKSWKLKKQENFRRNFH